MSSGDGANAPQARRALDAALLAHLVDDAAVFPPGSSPLDVAVADHLARVTTPSAAWTGPLLVPAADAPRLPALLPPGSALDVGVVARPGVPVTAVRDAVDALAGTAVSVVSVELGWAPGWRDALALAPTVVAELPREDRDVALAELAAARRDLEMRQERDGRDGEGVDLLVKWRTGATPTWAWPDADETATVLHDVVAADLPLKLTGGLHHALPADHGTADAPDPQHGLLGVLAAVADARAGAPPDALAATLRQTDPVPLLTRLTALTDAEVAGLRETVRSYGCCTVTDPLGELADLGVLPLDEGADP